MRPIPTDDTTITYNIPGDPAADLPARLDGGDVVSTWVADENDLAELTPAYPRLILDVLGAAKIKIGCKIGDSPAWEFTEDELIDERPKGDLFRRYTQGLSDRELQVLRDGARIDLRVGQIPPAPMGMQLA